MDPMPDEEYDEFCRLGLLPEDPDEETEDEETEDEEEDEPDKKLINDRQDALIRWIGESLEVSPETSTGRLRDSYYLKHVFENSPEGFYVTDEQFRAAMWISGFLGRRYPGRRYEDYETRYYYVRPNREGLIEKLVRAGVPEGWAREAIMDTDEIKGKEL
jgi:PAS domain-containing protein